MKRLAAIALAVAFVAAGAALAFVAARGPESPRTIAERVDRVAATLKCPACQDLSVKDSPSIVARQIRAEITRRLRAGQSTDEIRTYFESRFGEDASLTPTGGGVDLLAWLAPTLLVMAGVVTLGLALTRWSRPDETAGDPPISEQDRERLERELRALDTEVAP